VADGYQRLCARYHLNDALQLKRKDRPSLPHC
jgi:hypothetical protein